MRGVIVLCGAALALLSGGGSAQTPPAGMGLPAGFKLVEPSPPRAGDAAMSCDDIAREMYDIMQKRGLKKSPANTAKMDCEASRAQPDAANQAAMAARAMSTLSVMNDPRIMRLSQLSMAKQCADSAPPQDQTDPCSDTPADANDSFRANPRPPMPAPSTQGAAGDPFVQHRAPSPAPAPAPADPPTSKRK